MMVELFVAALALFLWLGVEPGIVRAAAFNTILIAGVSTLLFNANPLLRYDGYYILADFLEIPNLAQRSNAYLGYLIQRYAFRMTRAESPVDSAGERAWFLSYSIASFCYRIFVMSVIVLFVAGKYFFIGLVLAVWAVASMFIVPLWRKAAMVLFGAEFAALRWRAVFGSMAVLGVLIASAMSLPLPLWTRAEGVIRVPEESWVRAGSGGFVEQVVAAPNHTVQAGDTLIVLRDPELRVREKMLAARLVQERVRYNEALGVDRARANAAKEVLTQVKAQLDDVHRRIDELVVRSPSNGIFVLPDAADLPGRYLRRGALLGYILADRPLIARVVVRQDDLDLVRERSDRVTLRLAERVNQVIEGRVVREVPAATDILPSRALGAEGGGRIALDPRDPKRNTAIETLFEFEVALPDSLRAAHLGQRVYVRFDHGSAPLAWQVYRKVRVLFLSKFHA